MTTGEVVHEEVITKKYRAASPWAHVVHALIYITTLVLPLVLAFVSQGFWRKVEVYREQPIVEFTGKCVLLLQGEREGDYAVWSTFQTLNQASESHLKVPTLETEQKDHDGDERYDRITVVAEFSSVRFPVRSVLWVLLFKYQLDQRFLVEMESAITGEAQTQLQAGSKLRIAGELNMLQKDLFDRNFRLETPFNCSSPDIEQFKPFSMLTTGLGQNFSTELARQKVVWEPALTPTNDFTLSFHVHVPPQVFYYKTGVFELLKWAWIQYLSLLIIVHYLLRQFASFVYENHLLAVTTD